MITIGGRDRESAGEDSGYGPSVHCPLVAMDPADGHLVGIEGRQAVVAVAALG